ncbi:hypothetical protein STEG23_033252, partial [Scotinomys teguina]
HPDSMYSMSNCSCCVLRKPLLFRRLPRTACFCRLLTLSAERDKEMFREDKSLCGFNIWKRETDPKRTMNVQASKALQSLSLPLYILWVGTGKWSLIVQFITLSRILPQLPSQRVQLEAARQTLSGFVDTRQGSSASSLALMAVFAPSSNQLYSARLLDDSVKQMQVGEFLNSFCSSEPQRRIYSFTRKKFQSRNAKSVVYHYNQFLTEYRRANPAFHKSVLLRSWYALIILAKFYKHSNPLWNHVSVTPLRDPPPLGPGSNCSQSLERLRRAGTPPRIQEVEICLDICGFKAVLDTTRSLQYEALLVFESVF